MRLTALLLLATLVFSSLRPASADDTKTLLTGAETVLWLGDSITHAGGYVAAVETELRREGLPVPRIINIGLGSETLSGLSEPDHPFPRPDVHERLDRALSKVKPDLVVACYGMNDGIYHPFAEDRFAAYKDGVERLIAKVEAAGAELILLTPPPFDPTAERIRDKLVGKDAPEFGYKYVYADYDAVLARYADYLMTLRDRVAAVIDVHTAVSGMIQEARSTDPGFSVSSDGIHPNDLGHRMIAAAVLGSLKPVAFDGKWEDIYRLVKRRQSLIHDAYLTDIGHNRPGVGKGLPVAEAEKKAAALKTEIESAVAAIAK